MGQKTPATDWERRIDELMAKQIASPDDAERKRLFDEVQKIFAEHAAAVYFAAPRIYVGVSVARHQRDAGDFEAASALGAGHARRQAITR